MEHSSRCIVKEKIEWKNYIFYSNWKDAQSISDNASLKVRVLGDWGSGKGRKLFYAGILCTFWILYHAHVLQIQKSTKKTFIEEKVRNVINWKGNWDGGADWPGAKWGLNEDPLLLVLLLRAWSRVRSHQPAERTWLKNPCFKNVD